MAFSKRMSEASSTPREAATDRITSKDHLGVEEDVMPKNPTHITHIAIRLLGSGALLASGGVHLDLYLTGYRSIPSIGPLFIVQGVASLMLGAFLLLRSDELLLVGGSLLAVGTLTGYLLSRAVGILGFHEVATTAGFSAGILDSIAFVLLGFLALSEARTMSTRLSASRRVSTLNALLSRRSSAIAIPLVGSVGLILTLISGMGIGAQHNAPTGSSSAPRASTNSSVTITINNFAFIPAHVTVVPGERIVVHNEDSVAHTLTAVPGSTPFGDFNTGNIGSNQTKTFRAPTSPGSYSYLCAIHNFMTGVITVKQ